jgi:hypothetical protein
LKTEKENIKTVEKKLHAQKAMSYYKQRSKKLRGKMEDDTHVYELKATIAGMDAKIQQLEIDNEELREEQKVQNLPTKRTGGSYADHVRLCVMDLSGLEAAVEKINFVMRSVSTHLFGRDFQTGDLPSASTVQAMVDERHYIAKTVIAEKLSETSHWRAKSRWNNKKKTEDFGHLCDLGFRGHHEFGVQQSIQRDSRRNKQHYKATSLRTCRAKQQRRQGILHSPVVGKAKLHDE